MTSPLFRPVVDQLAAEIRAARLAPGTRLPTHRQLARQHGISLTTATRVYAELRALGLARGEVGRGTFVRETAVPAGLVVDQQAVATGVMDLNFNYPALPGQARLLAAGLRRLAGGGDLEALLRYAPHGGRLHERACVAQHLAAARGLTVEPAQVLIVDGAQHGLAVACMALLQPGDVVAVDSLTYPGFKALAGLLHLTLAPLPAGDGGADLEALRRLCARRRVRAVYVMPTLHNPLGWVSSTRWRQDLADIVRQHGLVAIEDAAYAFLAQDAPPPLACFAPESTVYVSGLSKSVATGLRFGFAAAPLPWVPLLERAIRASTWNTPGVVTALACGWLQDGTVRRLEAEKRRDAAARQAIARKALAGLPLAGHRTSYFSWLPLPGGVRADRVAAALLAQGVAVSTAEPFAASRQAPQAIRLALGSVPGDSLRAALAAVRHVVQDQVDR